MTGLLDEGERLRAAAFRFARDRDRFVASHGAARVILARYLETEPGLVRFMTGPNGKPALAGSSASFDLRFNLSHSGNLALVAVTAGREVGVDLERVRPIAEWREISERVFSSRERTALLALPEDARVEAFFRLWTRKEAFLKAEGEGIANALDRIEVLEPVRVPDNGHHVAAHSTGLTHWRIQDLTLAPGYVGAVAAEGHNWRLRWREK